MPLFTDDITRSMIQAIGAGAKGTYTPAEGGGGTEIDVDFRNEFEAAQIFGISVQESNPIAFVVSSDLTGTVDGGTLLIGSTTYTIDGPGRPDAEGQTLLMLKEE